MVWGAYLSASEARDTIKARAGIGRYRDPLPFGPGSLAYIKKFS